MHIKDFFYFSLADRRFIATLCMVVCGGIVAYHISSMIDHSDKNDEPTTTISKKSNNKRTHDGNASNAGQSSSSNTKGQSAELFYFDPNTADSSQLARLGIRRWQISNILRYRERGGTYNRKEDFGKVYGLTIGEYRRLAPYIRISNDYRLATSLPEVSNSGYLRQNDNTQHRSVPQSAHEETRAQSITHKIAQGEYVDINSADTTMLMRVPGIGSYYARQIVRARTRLGGFSSAMQLLDIADFPEEALSYISIDPSKVCRLNVNRLTLKQLKRHPYINYYQARAIIDLRRLRGTIHSIDELSQLKDFTADDISRLIPYLEF